MKNRILTVIFAVLVFGSCRGTGGGELELSFKADRVKIAADGRTTVTFSVYEGLENVTASARIRNITAGKWLDGNTFSSTVAGNYEFSAEYDARQAGENIIVEVEPVVPSVFVRNVCLMEFTDASCTFCPQGSAYIERWILSKMDNVHLLAFHEADSWKSDEYHVLFRKFALPSQPSVVVDMRRGYSLEVMDMAKDEIRISEENYPAHCGIALTSVVNESGTAGVQVRLTSERSTDYHLAVYVVEDEIRGYQNDVGASHEDYCHRFVERCLISGTVYGDALGKISSGEEKTKDYVLEVDPAWNLEKTYVYALALDADGYVNNMQVCLLDGGSAGYEYVDNQQ